MGADAPVRKTKCFFSNIVFEFAGLFRSAGDPCEGIRSLPQQT